MWPAVNAIYFMVMFFEKMNFIFRLWIKKVFKMSKRKHAQICAYTFNSALKNIQNMNRHGSKGDWRQNRGVCVLCKNATIAWKWRGKWIAIPVGMTGMLKKTQTAAVQNWESAPVTVRDHFQLTKTNFEWINFDVMVSYSGKCNPFIILLHCLTIYTEKVKLTAEGKCSYELFVS